LEPATTITTIATKAADHGTITATKAIISELAPVPTIAITIDKGKPTAPGGLMVAAGAVPIIGSRQSPHQAGADSRDQSNVQGEGQNHPSYVGLDCGEGCHNLSIVRGVEPARALAFAAQWHTAHGLCGTRHGARAIVKASHSATDTSP
jgi:hypothetical protein